MNVDSILIAEYATVDKGGRLTVVNAFNRLTGPGPRWAMPVLAIPLVIHGHSEEAETTHEGVLRLIDEERTVKQETEFSFSFSETVVPGLPLKHISNIMIMGATFDKPGLYAFEVYIDGIYMASASLVIQRTD